jgi:hypothetical protein
MTENATMLFLLMNYYAYQKIKKLQTDKYQIIFFSHEDDYKPMMPLKKLLSAKSFWPSVMSMLGRRIVIKIIKDGHEMKQLHFI